MSKYPVMVANLMAMECNGRLEIYLDKIATSMKQRAFVKCIVSDVELNSIAAFKRRLVESSCTLSFFLF